MALLAASALVFASMAPLELRRKRDGARRPIDILLMTSFSMMTLFDMITFVARPPRTAAAVRSRSALRPH